MKTTDLLLFLNTRVVNLFYRIVMPTITIILLLGVSSIIRRSLFSGSWFIDILIRVILSLWFCIGYISLPSLAKKYRVYPNIVWKKSDISPSGKFYYSLLGILFGVGIILMTWWEINMFIPIFSSISLFLATANGIIYAIPLVLQYEIFKL